MKLFDSIKPHKKIAENYFFMTFLQGFNLLISLLLYPYLIRVLGKEAYGTYIFILSNVQILNMIITFGFEMTTLKKISMNKDNAECKSIVLSEIFTAQICLFLVCGIMLAALLLCIPFMQKHYLLYLIVFSTTLISVVFPVSYFQGIQQMKLVTGINIVSRLLTIPLIFIFVQSPDDLLNYALIVSVFPLLGAFYAFFYIQIVDKIKIRLISLRTLKPVLAESLPFFCVNALERLKQESVTFIVGSFLGMSSVALWDLAYKIVSIPRIVTSSINSAIFPGVINNLTQAKVRKIFKFNTRAGVAITLLVALCSYWAVLVLGGKTMLAAYPLVIILSTTIYSTLIVDCFFNFVFVPHNRYYVATKNQAKSLLLFVIPAAIGVMFFPDVIWVVAAFAVSCFAEVFYCSIETNRRYVTKAFFN
ncbi:MAG: oligosaccharide flippase family protein [Bacteroidales bacterium]|jgi:PST family polysaccharide transporter|nr:oligosaccharide flippase family protein [Bacteroidales bacterium]